MRDDRRRLFLVVVWWQRVILVAHERLEEAPRSPAHEPELPCLARRELAAARCLWRDAESARDGRREEPEHDERKGNRQRDGVQGGDEDQDGEGQHHTAGHHPVEAREVESETALRLRSGRPFEQPPVRHHDTHQGPHDRIGHPHGLMGEDGDVHGDPGRGQGDVSSHRPHVAALRDPLPPRQERRGDR